MRTHTVVVGYANEQPFDYLENDELAGQSIEVLRAALKPYGVTEFKPVLVEFNGLIPGLVADRFDVEMAAMAIRPARCDQVTFGNPDAGLTYAFMIKADNPEAQGLRSYADVAKSPTATLGSITGGAMIALAQAAGVPDDRIIQFPDAQAETAALKANRITVLAELAVSINKLIEVNKDPNLVLVELTEQPLEASGKRAVAFQAAGFRKEDVDFVEAYNKQLAELNKSGALAEINKKYGFAPGDTPAVSITSADICAGKNP